MISGRLLAFLIYFAILLTIGLVSRRRMKNDADFIMGNRKVNFWLTALSAQSSDMSAWLFMGFPGIVFARGMPEAWIALGLVVGMFANWKLVAPRLRRMTESYDSYTLSTFFERRFNDHSGIIRVLTGLLALLFLTAYLTALVIAMGKVVSSLFPISYAAGILISMPILIFYVFIGGFLTVAWMDCFQAIFLICVVLFVPYIAYDAIGGAAAIAHVAAAKHIPISLFHQDWTLMIPALLYGLGWGMGYFGQPHIITKFMGVTSPNDLKKSMILGMSWQIVALSAAVFIGLIGIAYFPDGLYNHEMVFVEMVKILFNPFVASFLLCAVIAANMSTMDSMVLVAGSIFSEDIVRKMTKKPLGPKALLIMARIGVVLFPLIAMIIAFFYENGLILDMVGYAWAGLGATFGPIVFAALYSKVINKYGVISGVAVGGAVAATWPLYGLYIIPIPLLPIIPGFIASSVVMYVVSFLTRQKEHEHVS